VCCIFRRIALYGDLRYYIRSEFSSHTRCGSFPRLPESRFRVCARTFTFPSTRPRYDCFDSSYVSDERQKTTRRQPVPYLAQKGEKMKINVNKSNSEGIFIMSAGELRRLVVYYDLWATSMHLPPTHPVWIWTGGRSKASHQPSTRGRLLLLQRNRTSHSAKCCGCPTGQGRSSSI
jgi:hypothetical protein